MQTAGAQLLLAPGWHIPMPSQVLAARETLRTTEQTVLLNAVTAYMNLLRDTALRDFLDIFNHRLISLLFNALYNQTLSDIETCYKMMTVGVARSLRLSADDFGAEVEISANIARQRKLRIYELGITYYGRSYDEGKKINWKDGVKALWYLLKFRFA